MVLWWEFQYVFTSCQSKVKYRVWVTEAGAGSGQPNSQLKYRKGYLAVNQSGQPLTAQSLRFELFYKVIFHSLSLGFIFFFEKSKLKDYQNNRIIMPNGDSWFTVQNNNRPSHFLAKDKLPPRWNRQQRQ